LIRREAPIFQKISPRTPFSNLIFLTFFKKFHTLPSSDHPEPEGLGGVWARDSACHLAVALLCGKEIINPLGIRLLCLKKEAFSCSLAGTCIKQPIKFCGE
jgi:hypothetical protein